MGERRVRAGGSDVRFKSLRRLGLLDGRAIIECAAHIRQRAHVANSHSKTISDAFATRLRLAANTIVSTARVSVIMSGSGPSATEISSLARKPSMKSGARLTINGGR